MHRSLYFIGKTIQLQWSHRMPEEPNPEEQSMVAKTNITQVKTAAMKKGLAKRRIWSRLGIVPVSIFQLDESVIQRFWGYMFRYVQTDSVLWIRVVRHQVHLAKDGRYCCSSVYYSTLIFKGRTWKDLWAFWQKVRDNTQQWTADKLPPQWGRQHIWSQCQGHS